MNIKYGSKSNTGKQADDVTFICSSKTLTGLFIYRCLIELFLWLCSYCFRYEISHLNAFFKCIFICLIMGIRVNSEGFFWWVVCWTGRQSPQSSLNWLYCQQMWTTYRIYIGSILWEILLSTHNKQNLHWQNIGGNSIIYSQHTESTLAKYCGKFCYLPMSLS